MIQLSNRARSLLLVGIDETETSIQIVSADADLFPELLIDGDYTYCAIIDASNNVEFVKVTARVVNTLTIERGAAGTTARSFSAGSRIEVRIIDEAWRDLAENDWHRLKDDSGDVVTPVLVDGTSFYVDGDFTNFFPTHRALKVSQTSPGFGYVTSSSYSSGTNRTTVVVDNITLDSGLTLVEAGHDVDASPKYPHAATADNSDQLDGYDAADFSLSDHNHDGIYASDAHNHSGTYEPVISTKNSGFNLDLASTEEMEEGEADDKLATPAGVLAALNALGVPLMGGIPNHSAEFLEDDTWTAPAGLKGGVALVEVQAGGNAGGSFTSIQVQLASGSYGRVMGRGGKSGRYILALVPVTPSANYTITVGTAGIFGSASAGGSSFGALVTAPPSGLAMLDSSVFAIQSHSQPGSPGAVNTPGVGGEAPFGFGTTGYGGGGNPGGNGGPGRVRIWWNE